MQPALLVLLPGALTVALAVANGVGWEAVAARVAGGAVAGLLGTVGLATLVEQLVREQGKRKEPALWASWGGAPATRMLRHRERDLSTAVKRAHYHQKLKKLIRGIHLPGEVEEQRDPEAADQVYERCVEFLKMQTRDRVRFRLVFEENVNYGFCRNLWGMWPAGLIIAAVSTFVSIYITKEASMRGDDLWFFGALVVFVNAGFLAWWCARINRSLVFVPARAWSERLFEALDAL